MINSPFRKQPGPVRSPQRSDYQTSTPGFLTSQLIVTARSPQDKDKEFISHGQLHDCGSVFGKCRIYRPTRGAPGMSGTVCVCVCVVDMHAMGSRQ